MKPYKIILIVSLALVLLTPAISASEFSWVQNGTGYWAPAYELVSGNATTVCTGAAYLRTCEPVNASEYCYNLNDGTGSESFWSWNYAPIMTAWLNSKGTPHRFDLWIGCCGTNKVPCDSFAWIIPTSLDHVWSLASDPTSYPVPVCDFTATPASGSAPLSVTITDTSTNSTTARTWTIRHNSTGSVVTSGASSWIAMLNDDGNYDVGLAASNIFGNCTKFSPGYIQVNGTNPYIDVEIKDSSSGSMIQHAGVGIYDYTHTVWRNTTTNTGIVYYDSTGASYEYPLSVGQTVKLAAWATGFGTLYKDVTIQYNGQWHQPNAVQMLLIKNATLPSSGNATITVNVVSNANGGPLDGAYVLVTNNALLYGVSKLTTGGGSAVFSNIPAGDDYEILITKQGYNSATMYTDAPANVVTTVDVSLVLQGATPTPTGTITTTPTGTGTYDDRTDTEKMDALGSDALGWSFLILPLICVGIVFEIIKKMGK